MDSINHQVMLSIFNLPLLQVADSSEPSGWSGVVAALKSSFTDMGDSIVAYLPKVAGGIILFLVGWIFARIIRSVLHKALKAVKLDDAVSKVGLDKMLNKIKHGLSLAKILSRVVYWLIMLVVVTVTANVMGVTMVNDAIGAFFGYLPTLTVALLMFVIGVYIADLVKDIVYTAASTIGISGARPISNIVYYVLFIFITITALNQAGVDTSIISSNLTLILGAILLAFAVSYALGSWKIVRNMLSSYYTKGKYQPGLKVRIGQHTGEIEKVDSISVHVRTAQGLVVLPSHQLVETEVEILD